MKKPPLGRAPVVFEERTRGHVDGDSTHQARSISTPDNVGSTLARMTPIANRITPISKAKNPTGHATSAQAGALFLQAGCRRPSRQEDDPQQCQHAGAEAGEHGLLAQRPVRGRLVAVPRASHRRCRERPPGARRVPFGELTADATDDDSDPATTSARPGIGLCLCHVARRRARVHAGPLSSGLRRDQDGRAHVGKPCDRAPVRVALRQLAPPDGSTPPHASGIAGHPARREERCALPSVGASPDTRRNHVHRAHRDRDHRSRPGRPVHGVPPQEAGPRLRRPGQQRPGRRQLARHWDTLRLYSPAKYDGLPGMPFPADPWTFPQKDEVAAFLESLRAEVRPAGADEHPGRRPGTAVRRRVRGAHRRHTITCDNVVVATGTFGQAPNIPDFASDLDPAIRQLHSSEYHRPDDLLPGPVLVVGASHSGTDIAYEAAPDQPGHACAGATPASSRSARAAPGEVIFPVVVFVCGTS